MLGGNHIKSGAMIVLIGVALFGCAVPLPFAPKSLPPSPPITPPTPLIVEASKPPTTNTPVTPQQPQEGVDLWRKIGAGLALHHNPQHRPRAPLSQLPYGKRIIESASAQAEPYLHFIVTELDKRKLPYELALIPMLESGFNPAAGSRAGPNGLWQMIPATGQRFGLQQTAWYDGRRDVVASTAAALNYFEKLQGEFNGDWLLAIAAYNCGERTVVQAVERNRKRGRPVDFWSLGLPSGTRGYVERLLNVTAVVAAPAAFGVRPARVPDRPYFDVVDVGANLPLARIVAASGFGAEQFRSINAGLLKQTTVAAATRVLVAAGHGDEMAVALSSVSDQVRRLPALASADAPAAAQPATRAEHTVRAGESLSLIAAKANVSVQALRAANHLSSTHLRLGQVLRLPISSQRKGTALAASAAPHSGSSALPTATPALHVVTAGDNLWDVARHYHVSAQALASANGLSSRSVLKQGQKLRLPVRNAAPRNLALAAADNVEDLGYRVRQGDSLWTISRRFNVSVDALKKWNRLPSASPSLRPGQRLVVNGET